MSPILVANGDVAAGKQATGRIASVYSEVQTSRIDHALPLPSVLRSSLKIVDGPASSAAGNPGLSRPLNSH
jgi:pyrophosphate--fructose-6-phosphate 1-phosphotransferase